GPKAPPATEPALDEGPLGLREADLPGQAGVLDRAERRGARASVRPGDVHDLGEALGHAGGDGPHPDLGYQLHRDLRDRVHLLEVEYELGEVLDRVDVVMRCRADQGHPGLRVPEARDLLGDLVAGELPALARLRALGDLDLELVREGAVLGSHA